MAEKSVLVLLRHSPFNNGRNREGLRVAVGLTVSVAHVNVVLTDDAVWLALEADPRAGEREDTWRHWQTIAELGQRRLVERESLAERGFSEREMQAGVELLGRAELAAMETTVDAVVVY